MSEDNILNLEEESPAPVDPVEAPVEAPEETGTWEQELSGGLQRLFNEGLSPIRASITSLEESLRAVASELESISSAAIENSHLNSHVSRVAGAIKKSIDSHAVKAGEEFAKQLETERDRWKDELEVRLSEARQEVEQEFEPRLVELRREVELEWQRRVAELESHLAASREALALTVQSIDRAPVVDRVEPPVSDSSLYLKSAVAEINAQRTQADTLTSLIRNASHFAARVAFFVVRGGVANGWKASGFSNGLDDEAVKTLSIPVDNTTLIGRALLNFETVGAEETELEVGQILGHFGSPAPERAVAIPLVVRGRAAAVLYADSGSDSPESALNQTALELIMDVGSMGIELLPTRRSEPAPAVTRGTTPLPRPESGSGPSYTPPVVANPVPTASTPSPYLPPPPTEARFAPGNISAGETRELSRATIEIEASNAAASVEAAPDTDGSAGAAADEDVTATPALTNAAEADGSHALQNEADAPASPVEDHSPADGGVSQPAEPAFAPTGQAGIAARFDENIAPQIEPPFDFQSAPGGDFAPEIPSRVTKPVPDQPASMREAREASAPAAPPVISPGSSTETEQRAHNDARRFARLLVSEIKLYNGSKVNEGRRNHDLYTRLAEEITRSRKVYEKRVSPAVAARFDYFYDELVQTLAEGDKEKLGGDCPGPILR